MAHTGEARRTTEQLPTGAILAGYRIEHVIGQGGVGVVYLAIDLRLHRRVALKVLADRLSADPRARERFVRESRLAASLDHRNIVPIYGAGEQDGRPWISMRYVAGLDLRSSIERHGPLDAIVAGALLAQVAAALDAAHRRGLVHRDVKPSNILVEREPDDGAEDDPVGADDRAYLTDFGLTRKTSDLSTTAPGQGLFGTIDYVAPEQIEGGEIDGRTDQYSLAATLYTCLTAQPPFERDLELATLHAHLRQPPPRVTVVRPDLPPAVDDVVAKGLAKVPDDRFASTSELMGRFNEAIGVERAGVAPTLPPRPDPSWSVKGQKRLIYVAAAATLAVLVALVTLMNRPTGAGAPPAHAIVRIPVGGGRPVILGTASGELRGMYLSPQRDRMAYVADAPKRHIFVKQIDELAPGTRLTTTLTEDYSPAWSPDGQGIAFVGDVHGIGHIYVVNANGSNIRQLTHFSDEGDTTPRWSHDGTMIAFVRYVGAGRHLVFVMTADGQDPHSLTPPGADDRWPQWSPTADVLAVSRNFGKTSSIFLLWPDGRSEQQITFAKADDETPDWSPDGTELAFVRRSNATSKVELVPATGGATIALAGSADLVAIRPLWSPSGNRILFSCRVTQSFHLCVMSQDGFGMRRVTSGRFADFFAEWLDNRTILFARNALSTAATH